MGFISGEIQYDSAEGMIHSDIDIADAVENRAFLHALLDEWLDRGKGTGGIYFGECTFMPQSIQDIRDLFDYVKENRK